MIALAPIVTRLTAQCPLLRAVAGAAEFAAVADRVTIHPAAWVIPLSDSASADQIAAGPVSQRVETGFGIVIVAGDRTDQMGGAVADALTLVRREVLAALLGWAPDPMAEPMEFGEGSVLRFSAGLVWWQDSYFTAWHTRALPA